MSRPSAPYACSSIPGAEGGVPWYLRAGKQLQATGDEYTPTPAISHAILTYNRGRTSGLADGIVVTPSHNPPDSGGFKYNPPNGGPADKQITNAIEESANALIEQGLAGVKRIPYDRALQTKTVHRHEVA